MDADGSWWYFEAEPHRHDHGWYENEIGRYQPVDAAYAPDAKDWKDSLSLLNNIL